MDQTTPDSGAQVGAQAAEYGQPSMAEMTAELAIVHRALDRHKVSQNALARRCNLNPGYLSRVLSGSSPVTFAIFRAVWDMTRDPELIGLFDGDGARIVVVDEQLAANMRSLYAKTASVCNRVVGPGAFLEPRADFKGSNVRELRDHGDARPPHRLDVSA